jgi:hypothetical protein
MKDVDRKAPIVRSFTLSGGSFGGEIVIDCRRQPPYPTNGMKFSSIHSLPSKFNQHSGSALDRDTDDNETVASLASCATTKIKPNVEALQEMVAALTEIEKETAGRSSYQYSKSIRSDTIVNREPRIDRIRDNAAGEMAARHWLAEKGDLKQSRKTIQYRIDRQATEIVKCFEQDTETAKKLRTKVTKYRGPAGRLFVRGYDRQGRACFHFISRNAPSYSKTDPEGCMEVYFYILVEKAIACTEKCSRETLGTVIVRLDFKDFVKWHTPPLEFVKDMLVMLKDHYPERLHRVYLVDAPVVFRALWSLIKPFVDAGTHASVWFHNGR